MTLCKKICGYIIDYTMNNGVNNQVNYHPAYCNEKNVDSNVQKNRQKQPKYVHYNNCRNDTSILYIPAFFPTTKNFQSFNADVESYLKYPLVQTNNKGNYILDSNGPDAGCRKTWDTSMRLIQDEAPFFPNLADNRNPDGSRFYNFNKRYGREHDIFNNCFRNVSNSTNLDTSGYVRNGFKGHGRGIGDVNVEAELKFGIDTRLAQENVSVKEWCRFERLFRNYQNPNNLVWPYTRGGIDTRNLDRFSRKNYYVPS